MAPSESLSSQSLVGRALGSLRSSLLRNPFKRNAGYLVLDIGSSSVKFAEVHQGPGGPRVGALGTASVPPTVCSRTSSRRVAVFEAIRK